MSLFRNINLNPSNITLDASSRLRVGTLNTLFDGKILNADNTQLFDVQGNGTGTWGNNKFNMSVTSGQYLVRQSTKFCHYFSGKSQLVECTFNKFNLEANVTKRVGYFSSSAVAPFNTVRDGIWLENDGTTYTLKVARAGTETVSIPWTSWDGYASISGYNWTNFTVVAFDFLWLGGAVVRLFLKTNKGFELLHTVNYSGSNADIMMLSPNQPIRYEIVSTAPGVGSFEYVCSQVASEGSTDEAGMNNSMNTSAIGITVATIGTTYPIIGIRKKSTFRDTQVQITRLGVFVNSATDQILWSLVKNPTITGTFTYADAGGAVEKAQTSGTTTVTATGGRVLTCGHIGQYGVLPTGILDKDYLSYLGCTINNTMDQIVLCATPISATVVAFGAINYKEY